MRTHNFWLLPIAVAGVVAQMSLRTSHPFLQEYDSGLWPKNSTEEIPTAGNFTYNQVINCTDLDSVKVIERLLDVS
jgi:hypothetical protein